LKYCSNTGAKIKKAIAKNSNEVSDGSIKGYNNNRQNSVKFARCIGFKAINLSKFK
jgi:hypothetical protein